MSESSSNQTLFQAVRITLAHQTLAQVAVQVIAVNVYEKENHSAQDIKNLKAEGFRKMPFETKAPNEAAAIDMMLQHFKTNTAELAEFTKDYCISASIFSLLYAS